MAFEWLRGFHQKLEKDANYAEKTLTAYRLGMRAKGPIVGVAVEPALDCCDAARNLPRGIAYHPDQAPRLPLPNCTRSCHCGCVYRPVMSYQHAEQAIAGRTKQPVGSSIHKD